MIEILKHFVVFYFLLNLIIYRLSIKEGVPFRIIDNDNLFMVLDDVGYYLEDYYENSDWMLDTTIVEMLRSGEYKFEKYE